MNITDTIEPKVDQLTADHLIGRTLTIRITGVHLSSSEQPCELRYEGDNGLPYRPGKSMRRVLVHAWGGDVKEYAGRSLRLYRDDDVQFGGLKVGGIRISHMSHIAGPLTLALTAKKGSKKAFKVLPMPAEQAAAPAAPAVTLRVIKPDGGEYLAPSVDKWVAACAKAVAAMPNAAALGKWRQAMAPHFLAAEHADVGAVDHVQGVAQRRLDELAAMPAPADEGDGWPGPGGDA